MNFEKLELLIEYGADINKVDNFVSILLYKIKINYNYYITLYFHYIILQNKTSLYMASEYGYSDIVNFLLEKKANINISNKVIINY